MDARRLNRFVKRHGRQNGGNALGEHGLAGTRRAEQQNVVTAAAGDFESALGGHLSAHVAEIHGILRGFAKDFPRVAMHGRKGFGRVDEIDGLRKRSHGENVDSFDDRRFARVCFGHDDVANAAFTRSDGGGKRSANRTHAAVKRQFAKENKFVESLAEKSSLATQDAERHGQIKCRAFLANVRGGKIYRDALRGGKIEAAIFQRRLNALAAFLYGVVRQADNSKFALAARADVHFDFDKVGVNAINGGAKTFEKHG